jgi:hypothetical protein
MTFDQIIAYDDRDAIHTSRWKLTGVSTKSDGPTDSGWLWFSTTAVGDTVTVTVYSDAACTSAIATGSGDVSDVDTAAVQITLAEANSSGVTGELWIEDYTTTTTAAPMKVALCVDADLATYYENVASLPSYNATYGMAEFIAEATRGIMLWADQVFPDEIGGYGGTEDRRLAGLNRNYPDRRRFVVPDQFREAAIHKTLEIAFHRSHERADETMFSELADYHRDQRMEKMGAINPTLSKDPDTNLDADTSGSTSVISLRRV